MTLEEQMEAQDQEKQKKFAELEAEIAATREKSMRREQEMIAKLEQLNQKSEKLRQINAKQQQNKQ